MRFWSLGKMTLTWKEFLDLAAVVQNLFKAINNFSNEKIDKKELNGRVAKAAQKYLDLLKDTKIIEFTKSMRIGENSSH